MQGYLVLIIFMKCRLKYAEVMLLGFHLFQPIFKSFQIYNYRSMNYPYNQQIIFIILCKLHVRHVSQVSDLKPLGPLVKFILHIELYMRCFCI